jgi:hypothetical protein
MTFNAVTMTLRITKTGQVIDSREVTRVSGAQKFWLHVPSVPRKTLLSDPTIPTSPLSQPFTCLKSVDVAGRETGTLEFNSSAIAAWEQNWFKANRSVQLSMDVAGQPGESLTVNLTRVDETLVSVQSAFAKVAETAGAFVLAIATLLKAIALFFTRPFTRRRREEEPKMLTANGPQSLE